MVGIGVAVLLAIYLMWYAYRYFKGGGSCKVNSDCSHSQTCIGGVCTPVGYVTGCTYDGDCVAPKKCVSGACT
jgi:hypothetical protein